MSYFNLAKILAKSEIKKHLYVGPGWFSKTDIETGQTSKLIDSFSTEIGLWLSEVRALRKSLFLSLAQDTDLDSWGADLEIERNGDNDEDYRARLQREILRVRATEPAIITFIEDFTGLETSIIKPWQFQDFRGKRNRNLAFGQRDPFYGRSGRTRRTSKYWQGGVVDIVTEGFSRFPLTKADEVVAAGIKVYYTANITHDIIPSGVADTANYKNIWLSYDVPIKRLQYSFVRSGTQPRSGAIQIKSNTEIHREYSASFLTRLWDHPELEGHYTIYESGLLWSELEDYTWATAIDYGHSSQPKPEVVIGS